MAGQSTPTSDLVRNASASAVSRTRRFGVGAGSAAVDAMAGALKAADEITGEATEFVRDAVIGVMEGTGQVAKVSRPVIRDVVSAAVMSSSELGGSVPDASQQAVEGAIVGAVSAGVESKQVGAQASAGVVEAIRELGGNFEDIVAPAVHGVIIGVTATSGDLFEATRDTASSLLTSGAKTREDVPGVARLIVEEAIRASKVHGLRTTDPVMGAAQGCVEAAYKIDVSTGDSVRLMVMAVVDAPVSALSPSIRGSVGEALGELSDDLRARPQAWRGLALWRAGGLLLRVNGLDVGAALAYYLLLALFPLVALIIVGFSSFIDPSVIRRVVTEVVVFYFPSSQEFLGDAIDHLFGARIWASLIALGGMLLGAQGLFMAANRGVNRVFDRPQRRVLGVTVSTAAIVFLAVTLFLVSVGLTVVFQLAVGAAERLPAVGGPLNQALIVVTGIGSGVAPFVFAGLVFVVVYRYLPNQPVRWSDATFGGLVTVIMFEVAKHLFFWFGNLASQRSVVYGSLSSVILLLIWSHVAGMIFLYGAALTKEATDLRPKSRVTLRQDDGVISSETHWEADITPGRDGRGHRRRSRSRW